MITTVCLLPAAPGATVLESPWRVELFPSSVSLRFVEEGEIGIDAPANVYAFAERPLPCGALTVLCQVFPDTDRGGAWGPGLALVWRNRTLRVNLRADGRFGVDDGRNSLYGGTIHRHGWNHLAVHLGAEELRIETSADGRLWSNLHTVSRVRFRGEPIAVRIGKMGRHGNPDSHVAIGSPGSCRVRGLQVQAAKASEMPPHHFRGHGIGVERSNAVG